ncbi:MAG: BACON domain-containing carbohydrate-binding protein [Bacteroidales bacterium]
MKFVQNIIKKISYTALGCCLLLGTSSCKEEEVKSVDFGVSKEQFDFFAEGGSGEIQVTSHEEWTVESNAEWCLISPANGYGAVSCELRVDTSYLYKAREALLTFHCGATSKQIRVNQLGYEKVILPNEKALEVPDYKRADIAFVEVDVLSNVDFQVELPEDAGWLSYEISDMHVTSVPRPRKVKFTYGINTVSEPRMADIKFTPVNEKDQEATPASLTITQEAAPHIVPSRQGDSLAIVMISRMMNTMVDPSADGTSMIHWPDITLKEFPVENGKAGETELRVTKVRFRMFDTKESIPYQVRYLTKVEEISFYGNTNGEYRSIEWTPEISEMTWLKHLEIAGYGFTNIPDEIANMKSLETFELSGCYFTEIPVHIFQALPNLKTLALRSNSRKNYSDLSAITDWEGLGLRGTLPREIFLPNLESLSIQHNYIEGTIPDFPVGSFPNLKRLALNGNFLSGDAPEWIMKHPYLGCWEPFVFIFNQNNGKDSAGKRVGLTNEPKRVPDCPLTFY